MNFSLSLGEFLLAYVRWHYGKGFSEFVDIARNFFGFLLHFFSFKLLLRTLFSPWKRIGESYEKGLHIESVLSVFIVNSLMRVVGLFSRLSIILLGLAATLVFFVVSFVSSVIWLLMPIVIGSLLAAAFFLIFTSV
jgi:hypothetical protein